MNRQTKRTYYTYIPEQRVRAVNHYEKCGIEAATYSHIVPRSTLYGWIKLKKSGKKDWEIPASKRPKRLGNLKVTLDLMKEIISLKTENPQLLLKQIRGKLSRQLSESTICRILQKYKQIQNLIGVLEKIKIKKLTDS